MVTLRDDSVVRVLNRLHESAKADNIKLLKLLPRILLGKLSGKTFFEIINPKDVKDIYMPLDKEQGRLAYQTARAIGAKNIVEFGTSFGISAIYLAAAVKDNGGGKVIGTEIEPDKYRKSIDNISEAGLSDFIDVRLGDALETLKEMDQPVDMVLLDGWKNLYLPVLELLKPKLRVGSVVLGDNIYTFKTELKPYVEYMQSGKNGFESTTLPMKDGFEYSVYLGGQEAA